MRVPIRKTFSPYIPTKIVEFFKMLKDCQGVASGPVVNGIFLFNIPEDKAENGGHPQSDGGGEDDCNQPLPPTLVIIVEKDATEMGAFLKSIGHRQLGLTKGQSRRALAGFHGHFEVIDQVEGYQRLGKDNMVSSH